MRTRTTWAQLCGADKMYKQAVANVASEFAILTGQQIKAEKSYAFSTALVRHRPIRVGEAYIKWRDGVSALGAEIIVRDGFERERIGARIAETGAIDSGKFVVLRAVRARAPHFVKVPLLSAFEPYKQYQQRDRGRLARRRTDSVRCVRPAGL